jgi:hypothetical protein
MANQRNGMWMLLAGVLAGSILVLQGQAQSTGSSGAPGSPAKVPAAGTPYRYQPDRFAGRAGRYYALVWGIDSLGVKAVESGEIIRFTYRVLDPEKAKMLNEKKLVPVLIDPERGVKLEVPSLEQVGLLRQSSTPKAGMAYWMAFSNTGRPVKRGDRVTVVIGNFQAQGLNVD